MTKQTSNFEMADAALVEEIEAAEAECRRLEAARRKLWLDNAGVKPGDIVRYVGGGSFDKQEAVVRSIELRYWNDERQWVKVSFRKKDGTWSTAVVHAFQDWEHLS